MKPYRTLATVRLFAGMVGLTDNQAKKRMDYLSKIKDNVYEIKNEVVFKAGEIIGFENPPKPYRRVLEYLAPEKPEPEPEPVVEEKKEAEAFPKKRTYKRRTKA